MSVTSDVRDARSDFVSSLGRKVADARDLLAILEDEPSSKPARDELRRRLHALGAGARLLRLEAMSRSIQEALMVLERAASQGSLREAEIAFVAQKLDDLPALAHGDTTTGEAPRLADESDDAPWAQVPLAVLIVGGEALADSLTDEVGLRARAFECERTEEADGALQLARAYAPDLVIVDADLPRATELVEALLDDPLTEPVPIVVVGTFRVPDEAARFVALGVVKALTKPVRPETLRAITDEVLEARDGRTVRVTLGEPTLEQLTDRLADELKRALVEGVDAAGRACRVPLGEGTEVMGALWGAIARVQEIVTQRTGGAVRFGGGAPEGTVALAPWLHHDLPGADRMAGRGRGAATEVRLNGRRVVVADDDPGVTWFISDLLRTAGCEVHEALDGRTALDVVFRAQPDLVVSDILMPGLDGFALSRALRRDVALRDTPVILLSWKEDLLQRVRELGASAAAYMRKESDSRAILARVREVLRPRARIEMRLRSDGEVRGRLDELSPRLLLQLVCVIRKDARVAVRDATFFYEIDIRNGAPRKATRTASDGSYQSGERALGSLLGVGAGRFVVTPTDEPLRGDLTGTLTDQLARPLAVARGALAATTGAGTMYVERVLLDRSTLDEYLRATPDPARSLIERLAEGTSPRQMLLGGDIAPTLLEDVLADLAARGAIRGVEGADGTDLLTPAIDSALAVLRGAARPPSGLPPNARPSVPAPLITLRARGVEKAPSADRAAPAPSVEKAPSAPSVPPLERAPSFERLPAPPPLAPAEESPLSFVSSSPSPPPAYETLRLTDPPADPVPDEDSGVPSSLEDAVMRQLSERSPFPGPAFGPRAPLVEPSALRPRPSEPPPAGEGDEARPLPSIPPDAVVPDAASGEEPTAAPVTPSTDIEVTMGSPTPGAVDAQRTPAMPMPVDRTAPKAGSAPEETPVQYVSPFATAPAPAPASETSRPQSQIQTVPPRGGYARIPGLGERGRSDGAELKGKPARRRPWLGLAVAFVGLGAAVAAGLYFNGSSSDSAAPGFPIASRAPSPVALPSARPSAAPSPATTPGDLPPNAEVPAGYGYLEVAAPAGAHVRVDGALVGSGPSVATPVAPGFHEVNVEQGGREAVQMVEIYAGKTSRIRSAAAP